MSTTGAAIRVLHVDDDPGAADAVATVLGDEGEMIVETVAGARVALDRLADLDVDCVVSNHDPPDLDGVALLEAVRADDPDLPFLLFTGTGGEAVASRAISAGVTDYLRKGDDLERCAVLADRVRTAVERYRSRRDTAARGRRLSSFVEQSPLGVVECDGDRGIVRLNEAGEEILGYAESELRGETWETLVAGSGRDDAGALTDTGGGSHGVHEIVRKDGERIVCEWHSNAVTDDDGDVVAVFSQFQDVTDRHERRRRIEALHEATRELMAASSQAAVADRAVETARDVLGLPINSVYLYDADAEALVPAATTAAAVDLIGEPPVYEPGESLSWEAFRAGEVRVFEDVSAQPGRYNPETTFGAEIILPLGDHGVMYVASAETGAFDDADVTLARTLAANAEEALTRIEREETLRENQRRYRTLVDHFPDGAVFLFDRHLRYVLAGGAELSSVGLSADDFEGTSPHDLFPDDIADEIVHHYREALAGRSSTFEQEYQGEQYRVRTIPVRDDAGDIVSGIAVSQNITERKDRERELARQNERLEEFASVVSHDLRNPLNVAEGHVELLRQTHDDDGLDAISRAHGRMNDLIDDLLTLAREGETVGDVETVDLATVVERCWRNVDTDGATMRIQTDRTIRADPSRLQQLLENLVRNSVEHGSTSNRTESGDSEGSENPRADGDAVDSVEHGTTSGRPETDDGVTVTVGDLSDGFYVADDGPGIPASNRGDVFDAGYTTSEDGTGFGLSIVEQVAEAHGWSVRVVESDTGGARFDISGVTVDR
jgi:PAS domain S-box-containing protein